ncbi:MAG: hypothetical protein Fur0021_32580 [Candidatus Promineifilaceae bacterium]
MGVLLREENVTELANLSGRWQIKKQEMFVNTRYEHVVLDEEDVAIIAGTNLKLQELVAERPGWG